MNYNQWTKPKIFYQTVSSKHIKERRGEQLYFVKKDEEKRRIWDARKILELFHNLEPVPGIGC